MFGSFLSRFANSFDEKFEPAVLLLREDAPKNFTEIEALAGFRDLTRDFRGRLFTAPMNSASLEVYGYCTAMPSPSTRGWSTSLTKA